MARILIIGGTGNISQHTVHELASRGHGVTVLNRCQREQECSLPQSVAAITGDRNEPGVIAAAVARARPDCVMDFICFTPAQTEALASACAGRVRHVVLVSTVDAFGYPLARLPADEKDAMLPPVTGYAADKQRCEHQLRRSADEGDFELTITRPTYCLGRAFVASFLDYDARRTLRRIREGRPVLLPGDGTGRMHVSSARDCGRMHAELALASQAYGRVFNAGSEAGAMTHRAYLDALGRLVGRPPEAVPVPRALLQERFGQELERTIWGGVFQYDLAFSMRAFAAAFPCFRWENDLKPGLEAFLERVTAEGAFEGPPVDVDLEGRTLAAWAETGV